MSKTKTDGSFTLDQKKSEKARKEECKSIMEKYPDRIPILVSKSKVSKVTQIDKQKYLCPKDLTISQFIYVIRRRLKFPPETALFIFVNGTIPNGSQCLIDLYERHKSSDGFLRITYSEENVFG